MLKQHIQRPTSKPDTQALDDKRPPIFLGLSCCTTPLSTTHINQNRLINIGSPAVPIHSDHILKAALWWFHPHRNKTLYSTQRISRLSKRVPLPVVAKRQMERKPLAQTRTFEKRIVHQPVLSGAQFMPSASTLASPLQYRTAYVSTTTRLSTPYD